MSNKLRTYLTEQKKKMKPQLHKLDDAIEKFIENIEKEVDAIEDNPVFQRKMNQMIVDMSKEHSEFIMALRAVVAALDRGSQVIPMKKPEAIARGVRPDLVPQEGEEQEEEMEQEEGND